MTTNQTGDLSNMNKTYNHLRIESSMNETFTDHNPGSVAARATMEIDHGYIYQAAQGPQQEPDIMNSDDTIDL